MGTCIYIYIYIHTHALAIWIYYYNIIITIIIIIMRTAQEMKQAHAVPAWTPACVSTPNLPTKIVPTKIDTENNPLSLQEGI